MVEITDDEAALYDRQIRLWGVDAQRSLRAANVFVKRCGPLVCKHIVHCDHLFKGLWNLTRSYVTCSDVTCSDAT